MASLIVASLKEPFISSLIAISIIHYHLIREAEQVLQ